MLLQLGAVLKTDIGDEGSECLAESVGGAGDGRAGVALALCLHIIIHRPKCSLSA
jgi:hypothetical protein